MSENQKQQYLKQTLWNIANELRGNMDADDFRDYILGFIFYKYLSRKMESYPSLPHDCIAWHNSLFTTGIAIIGRMRMG